MTFGDRIKYRRTQLGLTQDELAKRMGNISKAAISNIENRATSPKMDLALKYADALECTAAWLYGIEEEPPAPVSSQILSEEETQILEAYRQKSPAEKEAFRTLLGIRGDEG